MTDQRMIQILWYLIDLADEYKVPWYDYFSDEYEEYREEVDNMKYWDGLVFMVDKRLAAEGNL
jgi:hypothetical protein